MNYSWMQIRLSFTRRGSYICLGCKKDCFELLKEDIVLKDLGNDDILQIVFAEAERIGNSQTLTRALTV